MENLKFEINRTLNAPVHKVFELLTKEEHLKKWSSPNGYTINYVEGDLKLGGFWLENMVSKKNKNYTSTGNYTEIIPPKHIAFTHQWKQEDGDFSPETVISIDLSKEDGKTHLYFSQMGFNNEMERDSYLISWSEAIDKLQNYIDKL